MRAHGRLPARTAHLALVVALCSSCARVGGGAPATGVRSLAEFRHEGVVLQEWDLSCGAAAIATLLTHHLHDPVTERAAAEAMLGRADPLKVRVQGGFSLLDLQEFAESRGYEANGYGSLSLDDVVAMAPAIVPVTFHGFDHFVVLRGARGGAVLLADPAFGGRSVRAAEFERAWNRRIAFVIEGRLASAPSASSAPDDAALHSAPGTPVEHATDVVAGDETARALERTLVRRGALVLPPRRVEVEPEVGYVYREADGRRHDTVTPAVSLRVGLPWRAQADVRLPYVALNRRDGVGTGSGLADVEVALTKHVLYERGAVPEMLVTARWKTTTGSSAGRLPTGTGSDGVQAVLTGLKRDPPVVLIGSLYYVLNLPARGVDPGDAVGTILTTILAATPDVSLLLGIDVANRSASTFAGEALSRTDRLAAIVNVGLARVLSRNLGATVTAGIGVTSAAPPLLLTVTLPMRL